jgi:4-amino-4-deoxy-L-arabinose transferase-like glycosyltransferase
MLAKTIDKIFEIIYSKDKTKLYILLIFIFGLILRIIAANNGGLSADDAGHAMRAVGVIESGKLEEYGQSSILWYYIQETFMKVFGASQLGSRMASAFFGSFFIILIYMFVMQVFKSKKAALIASTLAAFSPWFIKMTLPEMDIAATFFIIFSALFIFKFIEDFKNKNLILASILMGLAVMIKVYSLFFAFSFFIFLGFYCKRKGGLNFTLKKLAIFCIILLIFCMPTLTHNYLLYKDKGFIDYMGTNILKLGIEKSQQFYSWAPGWNTHTDFGGFFFGSQKTYLGNGQSISGNVLPGFLVLLKQFFVNDPLIMIFGVFGIVYMFIKKERKFLFFFFASIIIPFIYLGAHINMIKHQTYMPVFLVSSAAFFINFIHNKLPKIQLKYILILIILFNIIWLGVGRPMTSWNSIYEESSDTKIIDAKVSNIDKNSLVVYDGRIFRGIAYWILQDRNFIESSLLDSLINQSSAYGNPVQMNLYFIECVIDDCGWGTIKNQPEFNKSMENIVDWFANNSKIIAEASGPDYTRAFYFPFINKKDNITRYRIYKTSAIIPSAAIILAKSTHNYILYPIAYDRTFGELFDDYETHGTLDKFLNNGCRYLLYLSIILAIVACLFLLYIFVNE